ncbi:unnamed protein product, partial [Medioppia subpectinata]
TSGVVRGQTIDVLNVSIDQFLSIPYAEPPVGRLRFAKPEPISTPIEPFIDGRVPGKSCVQKYVPQFFYDKVGNIIQSEDCLVLNVWTPTARTGDRQKAALKPVMFWIYGGGFAIGSIFQHQYNASLLAAHDVVVVSVNYRLGPFGWLYGDREDAPGNVGFYDQLLALKWVRENIHMFGGDKDQITIFGESAGSWSGSAHIISPLSKGLFKRVIMQSGAHYYNPDRDPVNTTEALFMAKQFAKSMNCTDEQKWLDCLRGIDAQALIKGFDTNVQIFPILGTEFLPMSAQQAFKQVSFNKDLDIMAGVERNEGSVIMQPLVISNPTVQDFTQLVSIVGSVYHNYDIKRIVDFYTKSIDTNNSDAILWAEYNFFSDVTMICPTYRFAKAYGQLSGTGSVYFYDQTYARQSYLNETLYGVTHFADIDFVFGLPLLEPSVTDTAIDRQFSLQVMKWWTDFAKYGRPDPKWPKLIGDKPGVKLVSKVRENIHMFGGDKDQITIFGESAGSWSGSAHIISPLSKGLFKRVIMQSGAHYYNPDRDPVNTTEALFMAKQFAKSMNCTDEQKWLDCLRGIDAQALIKGFDTNVQIFPILGTEFLPMSAQQAFKQVSFNKDLDIMAGVERNEGSVIMQPLVISNPTVQDFTQLVSIVGSVYHNYDIKRIVDFYTKSIDTNNSDAILWAEYNFFSDVTMICPTYRFAKAYGQLSGTGSVYFYDQTYARQSYLNETLYGVTHFADIDFVFGLPLLEPSVTDTAIDRQFSLQVMKWWTDFAKYGRPDPKWPKLIGDKPGVKLVSKVKDLSPHNLYYYFEDLFAKTCD